MEVERGLDFVGVRFGTLAGEGRFEHLVLCAPPAFMGELRDKLDAGVRQRVSAEVTKDLTRSNRGADVRTHLPDYLY
ncbi:MAG: host attachment protein [Thiohalospira sp.]